MHNSSWMWGKGADCQGIGHLIEVVIPGVEMGSMHIDKASMA